MPRKRVFYEDWQLECCGTPFAVGDEVTWTLVACAGTDRRYGAEAWVQNHGGTGGRTAGRVRDIELVHQEYTCRPVAVEPPGPGRGLVLRAAGRGTEPVPGSVTREPVDRCPRSFQERDLGTADGARRVRRTVGVLVTLDLDGATGPGR
ncbi:DUF6578 domain-containing protein [Streptomyces misionensis]